MILEIDCNFARCLILEVRASNPLRSKFFWVDICIASLMHFGTATVLYSYYVIDIALIIVSAVYLGLRG